MPFFELHGGEVSILGPLSGFSFSLENYFASGFDGFSELRIDFSRGMKTSNGGLLASSIERLMLIRPFSMT
jgi:hypothetical protein